MSKIALINDQHFGIKNDSSLYLNYTKKFYNDIFFPYLDKNNIKTVIDLGDTFDKRKFVNLETLTRCKEFYFDEISKRNIDLHILLGNHTTYYKNTSDISMDILIKEYSNIRVYKNPCDIIVNGFTIGMIPWINSSNEEHFVNFIKNSKSTIAMGHLEIQGFQVLRGISCESGLNKNIFNKFEYVYSGHFHQKHDDGHIYYLGTQYDMTFSDVDERKGFHVLDLNTRNLEFVENPYKLFYRIYYNEDKENIISNDYKNSYIKLIIKKKTDAIKFDKYIQSLYEINPAELSIIDDTDINISSDEIQIDETNDTISIIYSEIDNMDISNRNKIKEMINTLYTESHEIGNEKE